MKKKRTREEWEAWLDEFCRGSNREAWRGIMCLLRWVEIREENGHPVPPYLRAIEGDLYHSPLLRRLIDGKEPLPTPPPEHHGQPWYELLESGRGVATEVVPWRWAPDQKISIDEGIWTIVEKRSDCEYLVSYRVGGELYRLSQVADRNWLLERC
jgi:hypothetical protein